MLLVATSLADFIPIAPLPSQSCVLVAVNPGPLPDLASAMRASLAAIRPRR